MTNNRAKARPDKIPTLKPAFSKTGTITAANASSISDGAAALVLMRAETAERLGLPVLPGWWATRAMPPCRLEFTSAPSAPSTSCWPGGLVGGEVDLFEVNEAFAMVSMLAMAGCRSPSQAECEWGACALGHPLGASSAASWSPWFTPCARGPASEVASLCIGAGRRPPWPSSWADARQGLRPMAPR